MNFTSAFSRRVWQPSEQPRTASRIVAVSVAVTLTAGVALGIGMMRSYDSKLAAEEKAKAAALTRRETPSSTSTPLPHPPVPHPPVPRTSPSPSGGHDAGPAGLTDPRPRGHKADPAPAPESGLFAAATSHDGASLPFGPRTRANLFVQFAQVRLATQANAACKLRGHYSIGVLDKATVTALTCFQRDNDKRFHGVTARTDGLGRLGRSTMTALLMAHFGTSTSVQGLAPGDRSDEVPWLKNALVWADGVELDNGDIAATGALTKVNIDYLTGGPRPTSAMDSNVQVSLKYYQDVVGLPATSRADSRTLAALHAGRVKSQKTAGVVTAHTLPSPTGRR
ncbi:MAG: hypothetical protein JWO67_6804 [Streptosporangiaceae bacterium]|nr:hypothetical protein [Streptosporangiaceae bacterium]